MVQVLEKIELEEQEEIFVVLPEEVEVKKEIVKEEPKQELKRSRKHKKSICIDKVKARIDTQILRNRFGVF
ncbi:MAG: hypothetical protein ACFE9N_10710 [Promethearchaeota archaeon]